MSRSMRNKHETFISITSQKMFQNLQITKKQQKSPTKSNFNELIGNKINFQMIK